MGRSIGEKLDLYYPSYKTFPSISSTGKECHLNCEHCKGHYLKNMIDANISGLYNTCLEAKNRGAKGALISGGSDRVGEVILDRAELKMACEIKDFIINLHTGLITSVFPEMKKVDMVSVDIPPSDKVINEIYHLNANQDKYFSMLDTLEEEKIRYMPHICIGLEYGKTKGEIPTLERLSSYKVDEVVILSLKRTISAQMTYKRPNIRDLEKVINYARDNFKYLNLGCMRDRSKNKEKLWHYFDKIAWPSKIIKEELLKNNQPFKVFDTCCSV